MGVPQLLLHDYAVPSTCKLNCLPSLRQEPEGEAKKPRWDMAFLMIVPSTNARGDQLSSLAVVWAHPPQGHFNTLAKAGQKLMLLADNGSHWPYVFVHISNTMLHVPLSNNRHIGAMTDGVHTVNACSQLHQLQVWKLLQHDNSIVFPVGLNREPEALQFSFQELPLWNVASVDGPTHDRGGTEWHGI